MKANNAMVVVNNSNENQIGLFNGEVKNTITSIELVEQINFFRQQEKGKNFTELVHKNLLAVIRDEFEEELNNSDNQYDRDGLKIQLIFYKDSMNRDKPAYELSFNGAKQVLMRESKFVRKAVVKYIEELENKLNNNFTIPKTFGEALKLAYEQQMVIEEQNKLIENQKPKVIFYDQVIQSDDTLDMNTVAKTLNFKGVGRNKMFSILRDNCILMKDNTPYQKYVDNGCFKIVEVNWVDRYGDSHIQTKTVVYQKGVEMISKLLRKLGYIQSNVKQELLFKE